MKASISLRRRQTESIGEMPQSLVAAARHDVISRTDITHLFVVLLIEVSSASGLTLCRPKPHFSSWLFI